MWDVNEALVPAAAILNKTLHILRYIRNISGGLVIVIHLRSEQDWIDHCDYWNHSG